MRRIAVIGFSTFEFGAFEAFFKMVGVSRPPGFAISNHAHDAEVVFVNGVSASAVNAVKGMPSNPDIVIVGSDNFGTTCSMLARPIRLTSALALANQLLAKRGERMSPQPTSSLTGTPIAVSQPRPAAASAIGGLRAGVARPSSPSTPTRESGFPVPPTRQSPTNVAPENTAMSPELDAHFSDDILVVDDSDIALKFMQDHLGSFGFRVHLARSGEECLMMISQRQFRCVFLDVMMAGIDGYQTCRMVKQRKYKEGASPTVIMMTSRSGAIDRVRGALAGCDGYLVKPVDETKLIKALFQHRVSTSPATSSKLQVRLTTLSR